MNQIVKVVGMTFRQKEDKEGVFERLRPKGLVTLVPDPDNKFDKQGTAVEVRMPHPDRPEEFVHIGFLPATDDTPEIEEQCIRLKQEVHDRYNAGEQTFACVLRYGYYDGEIGFNEDHVGKLQSMLLYVSDTIEGARDGWKKFMNDTDVEADKKPAKKPAKGKPEERTVTPTHYIKGGVKYRRITDLLGTYKSDGKEGFDRIILWAMQVGLEDLPADDLNISDHKAAAQEIFDSYKERFKKTGEDGTDHHAAIEAWLKAAPKDRDDSTVPAGFLNWHEKYNPKVLGLETTVYNKLHKVAGTYDLKCEVVIKGKPLVVVVDWKSSKAVRKSHKMQAGFYTVSEDADEGWVVAFGAKNNQQYSMNRQDRDACRKQMRKIEHLVALQELEK